jgi:hypothetical protein
MLNVALKKNKVVIIEAASRHLTVQALIVIGSGHTKERCFKMNGCPPHVTLAHNVDILPEQPREPPNSSLSPLLGK